MKKQSIVKRLRYSFLLVVSLVALSGIVGIFVSGYIGKEADIIFDELYPIAEECHELEKEVLQEMIAIHSALLGEVGAKQRMEAAFKVTQEQLDSLESTLSDPADIQILDKVRNLRERVIQESLAAMNKDSDAATLEKIEVHIDESINLLINDVERLVANIQLHMSGAMKSADRVQTVGLNILISVTIGAFVLALFIGSKVSASIVNPLQKLVSATGDLAKGNLNADYNLEDTGDEIGEVNRAFSTLLVSQREITDAARLISAGDLTVKVNPRSDQDTLGIALSAMISGLREQIQTVIEGTNILASSVQEISASSAQLASSSAENATAISQTTSTIEEVRQTTDLASKKSRQLADEAHENRETSVQGLEATNQTVESISKIQIQMSAIADTIIALSQQSQSIGQIIASVDSIAEQSNVLAVNASIEAAKAGEQGRGFSVVAQEVKNLAKQSKQATEQVRAILNEIQHSTNSAIMATEQGTKVVESGTETAKASGKSIESLADSIDHSTDAATQIASASQQQRVGMDQISAAMENVREASQQNASSAKQLETAVHDLNQLGSDLKSLTQKYKT